MVLEGRCSALSQAHAETTCLDLDGPSVERAVVAEARQRGAQGVVCGHIHKAEIREIDCILYCNDGDWVESLTALVERDDGSLQILSWHDVAARTAHIISSEAHEESTLAHIGGH